MSGVTLDGTAGTSQHGRVALVTGVSRPVGIGAAIARRLHEHGATVFATGWPAHDEERPWGASAVTLPVPVHVHDLEAPDGPASLIDEVVEKMGRIDIVVAVHARSSAQDFGQVDAEELDRCWAANVRSVVLLAQRFAEVHQAPAAVQRPIGRMVWFTSGQHKEPMDGALAYAVTKGALHQMTDTVANALSKHQIVANCINPGPVDTGYATGQRHSEVAAMFPDGQWGTVDDVANLVDFLLSDAGAWIRGQVIDSEGGFDRRR